ncbi:hypothetical protein BCR33DRAFT_713422 [Rhizoclosmatium globosum]|uniref:Uncharacterized protein n=1 Tax=Rhizoclosmatium globosum TaxID=329046 RepID=A0A1Y2CS30_9FUNG|nr:hypothetical protein BCR33DRAFT_713422 [Rhizoclosmatium globosum]|eukprot:ORY49812.1 hypothetical protein BCR33DRAFT_713422 [Rhizoclosmatium globosum]
MKLRKKLPYLLLAGIVGALVIVLALGWNMSLDFRVQRMSDGMEHVKPPPHSLVSNATDDGILHMAKFSQNFVFGNAKSWENEYQLSLERLAFPEDTVITERPENMESGKNYDWLQHPSRRGEYCLRYQFIGKTDDDTVIHVGRLSQKLKALDPKQSHYYGRNPPKDHDVKYMTGLLYILSAELVEWINFSPIPPKNLEGYEDILVGTWLKEGKIAMNFVNDMDIHDLEGSPWSYQARSQPDSAVIHWCKDSQRLFRLTSPRSIENHFNRIKSLMPHIKKYRAPNNIPISRDRNVAIQIDAALLKLLYKSLVQKLAVKGTISAANWTQIMDHIAARIAFVDERPLYFSRKSLPRDVWIPLSIWRAISAMNIRTTPQNWEIEVAVALAQKAENRTLTWAEIHEIKSKYLNEKGLPIINKDLLQ